MKIFLAEDVLSGTSEDGIVIDVIRYVNVNVKKEKKRSKRKEKIILYSTKALEID